MNSHAARLGASGSPDEAINHRHRAKAEVDTWRKMGALDDDRSLPFQTLVHPFHAQPWVWFPTSSDQLCLPDRINLRGGVWLGREEPIEQDGHRHIAQHVRRGPATVKKPVDGQQNRNLVGW